MNFLQTKRIAPDGTPRLAASHLGLFCLPTSHKKDARLKRANKNKSTFDNVPVSDILIHNSSGIWMSTALNCSQSVDPGTYISENLWATLQENSLQGF